MSSPARIQLRRTAGWRTPPGAVVVARGPGRRWGNPVNWRDYPPDLPDAERRLRAVHEFRTRLALGTAGYPSRDEIRAELAGRDLCCWCPPDQPCHADVLLAICNGGDDQ